MYAKISKKGQVTIPEPIRKKLKIEKAGGILFLIEDNEIKLKGIPGSPARDLAGSLKKYAEDYVLLKTIRKKIKGIYEESNIEIVACILAAHSSRSKVIISFDKDFEKLKAVREPLQDLTKPYPLRDFQRRIFIN